jgi:DNA-binding NarL/FixJ family response regulator
LDPATFRTPAYARPATEECVGSEIMLMNARPEVDFIVADDHPLVRQGVRMVLETEFADSRVIEAADLDAALTAVVSRPGALLLIDLDMPGMDGVESLRALRQDFPQLMMAVLSGNSDRTMIIDALNAGVNGYILKASPPEELLYAVSTICGGRIYLTDVLSKFSHQAAPAAARPAEPDSESGQDIPTLTPRQREVVAWLMKGHSNKQIARDLNIGEGTVKIHMAAILRSLGAQNRTDAVMIAARLGM